MLIKYIVAHRTRFMKSSRLWKSDIESHHRGTFSDHIVSEFLDISFCGHSLGGAIGMHKFIVSSIV